MIRRNRIFLALFTMMTTFGCDQITKFIAASSLPRRKLLSFASDTLRFDYVENEGGILTFEPYLPQEWRGSIFTLAVSVLVGSIILYLLFGARLRGPSVAPLSLFCGGVLSNLVDRVAHGYVVDFINMGWGGSRTGIFNVADIAITTGLLLFGLNLLWNLRPSAVRKSCGRLADDRGLL